MANWITTYALILDSLGEGQQIKVADLFSRPELPRVTEKTKRDHLKKFLVERPEHARTVVGFFPPPTAVIAYVESQIGRVTDSNIEQANEQCRILMMAVGRPVLEEFVAEALGPHISGVVVSLRLDALINFLIEDFSDFARGSGNGLVSMAGRLNEELLLAAMRNGGMTEGINFSRTGTNSEGDIVIYTHVGTRENLTIEVKSYHARERLLRGLQDINGLKVGAGFFKSAHEFNAKRTRTLLQADPAAIYMPRSTLELVTAEARALTTNSRIAFQSRLYRPLERFASDMKFYYQTGNLPQFR